MQPAAGGRHHDRLSVAAMAVAVVAYLLVRVGFIYAREPFFDELFTRWIVALEWRELLAALRSDSGPILYYAIVKLLTGGVTLDVSLLRLLTLLVSCLGFTALLIARLGTSVAVAATLLLALYPPHVYFASEARSYALCAACIGIATAALIRDRDAPRSAFFVLAVVSLASAAYAHYYGIFGFALPLIAAVGRDRRRLLRQLALAASAGALFIPGALLLAQQPPEAIAWMEKSSPIEVATRAARALPFAGEYPEGLMPSAPLLLQLLSALTVVAAVIYGVARRPESRFWFAVPAVFVLASVTASALGRSVYFPMRLESVVAVPLAIGLALALGGMPVRWRRAMLLLLLAPPLLLWFDALRTFAAAREAPFRDVARAARRVVPQDAQIVTSGLIYLELLSQRNGAWDPTVATFPREQAAHPGWRARVAERELAMEAEALAASRQHFFWVGEWVSPERAILARHYRFEPIHRSGVVVLAFASKNGVEPLQQKQQRQTTDEVRPDE